MYVILSGRSCDDRPLPLPLPIQPWDTIRPTHPSTLSPCGHCMASGTRPSIQWGRTEEHPYALSQSGTPVARDTTLSL